MLIAPYSERDECSDLGLSGAIASRMVRRGRLKSHRHWPGAPILMTELEPLVAMQRQRRSSFSYCHLMLFQNPSLQWAVWFVGLLMAMQNHWLEED